jgi:hypothetical protein
VPATWYLIFGLTLANQALLMVVIGKMRRLRRPLEDAESELDHLRHVRSRLVAATDA